MAFYNATLSWDHDLHLTWNNSWYIWGDASGTTPPPQTQESVTHISTKLYQDLTSYTIDISSCALIGRYSATDVGISYTKPSTTTHSTFSSVGGHTRLVNGEPLGPGFVCAVQLLAAIAGGFVSVNKNTYTQYKWPFNASGSSAYAQFILGTGPQWKQLPPETLENNDMYWYSTTTTTNYSYNKMKLKTINTCKTPKHLKINVGGTWKMIH